LTLQKRAPKSNGKVSRISPNWYAYGPAPVRSADTVRETGESAPSERLLHQIWQHQRLKRDQLRTLDGKPVTVLHPGFWNHESGPDFRQAILQIGSEPPRSGDIEIDLHPAGWRGHHHDRNPAYHNVILHVVWDGAPDLRCLLPTLALKLRLDAPVSELARWLGNEASPSPGLLAGQCCAPLRDLSEDVLRQLLEQAAIVRLQRKASELAARARQVGWEQALWEGLFAALGYKKNVWPMRRLAGLLPQLLPVAAERSAVGLQACLLGVSGLLPTDLTRAQRSTDGYLQRVWDHWWRERAEFESAVLPGELWRFNGLRPANHPQRRLALAAHWLATGDLPDKLERWFTAKVPDSRLASSLLKILQVRQDEFWSSHWTLRSKRMSKPQPLLGPPRVTDLAVNVILPWFWTRASSGQSGGMQRTAERRYFAWPPAEDNAVLRLARQRLLGGARARALPTAAMQQGVLQIVRDFCEHSNALCENCRFPDLVRSLRAERSPGGRESRMMTP